MTQLFGLMSHQAHFSSHLMVRSSFRDRTSVRPGEMPNEQVSETKKEVGRNEEDLGATAWEDPCEPFLRQTKWERKIATKIPPTSDTAWGNTARSTS